MSQNNIPVGKILALGLLVGTLDMSFACIDAWISNSVPPDRVFKYIGGAVFDKAQVSGPFLSIAGIIFHYIIATSFTFLFFFFYPALKRTLRYNLVIAVLYALFMQAFMRFIVLPLTRIHLQPFDAVKQLRAAGILLLAIAIPLILIVPLIWRSRDKFAHKAKH